MQLACGSFQLMHMIRDDHAVQVEQAMIARKKMKNYYSTHNFVTGVSSAPKRQYTMAFIVV